tara:strand:- start:1127 stop:1966 length:840 start_codon:yes stop_codon:yes gene_type:complete
MKLFVIGNPIKHSMSPEIHNYWLQSYKIDANYQILEVEEQDLADLVERIRRKELVGVNVTLPYKTIIVKYLDKLDDTARMSGSVNTIYREHDKVIGSNTDGVGFLKTVKKDLDLNVNNKNFFIIGSGGASRGIIFSLCNTNIGKIIISNRNTKKARLLVEEMKEKQKFFPIFQQTWSDKIIPEEIDIVVNTTSFGLKENEELKVDFRNLNENTVIYDIIYNPLETKFLKKAKSAQLTTVNGISMLVHQAAESFRKWFNIEVSDLLIESSKTKLLKLLSK